MDIMIRCILYFATSVTVSTDAFGKACGGAFADYKLIMEGVLQNWIDIYKVGDWREFAKFYTDDIIIEDNNLTVTVGVVDTVRKFQFLRDDLDIDHFTVQVEEASQIGYVFDVGSAPVTVCLYLRDRFQSYVNGIEVFRNRGLSVWCCNPLASDPRWQQKRKLTNIPPNLAP